MSEYDLSAAELEHGWAYLRRRIDTDHAPQADPVAVFLGAQPAAGKSQAQESVLSEYRRDFLVVDSDALRAQHPQFDEIMATDPVRMPVLTNQAASYWTRATINYAQERGLDVLVENTFHNADTIIDSAAQFRRSGHSIHVVALAVPPEASRLAMVDRYLTNLDRGGVARWTTLAAHNRAVAVLGNTLDRLHAEAHVDRITILDRAGTHHVDVTRANSSWNSIVPSKEHDRVSRSYWTSENREQYAHLFRQVTDTATRTESITIGTADVFTALSSDAHRIAPDALEDHRRALTEPTRE